MCSTITRNEAHRRKPPKVDKDWMRSTQEVPRTIEDVQDPSTDAILGNLCNYAHHARTLEPHCVAHPIICQGLPSSDIEGDELL